ncbi:hypothetical protein Gpo141_00002397 [Globisporangium polare]
MARTSTPAAAHVEFYDQRETKDVKDESKRRRLIRWIKGKIGIHQRISIAEEEPQHEPDNGSRILSKASSLGRSDSQFISSEHRVHVIIVGAGIGGLCLAQGLKKHGIPFTVFERDPSPNYRSQGYRLRINSSGYEALKANLFPEDFEVFLRSAGHFQPGYKYVDAQTGHQAPVSAAPFSSKPGNDNSMNNVFSADRAMLRTLLLTDLNEHEIQFGHAFKRYDVLSNGRVEVTFENGRVIEGSVLIGAEGTTSRIRRQYIPKSATLLDTDSGAIYGKTPITPEIASVFTTEYTTMAMGETPKLCLVMEPLCSTDINKTEFAEVSSSLSGFPDLENYICWVLFGRADYFESSSGNQDLFMMSPAEVAALSCEMTSHWAPQVCQVLEQQAPEWCSFLRISTTSPKITGWEPSVVTLLGDAVHTMVPAGIGCNTALRDAQMLVKFFREHGVGLKAIAAYERQMREYGSENITTSLEAGKKMFNLPPVSQMLVVAN